MPGVAAAVPDGFTPQQASQVTPENTAVALEAQRLTRLAVDSRVEEKTGRIQALAVTPEPETTPPANVPSEAVPEPPPLFTIYQVQLGDTVSSIAAKFGLQSSSIVWNNVEINNEDELAVGQSLRIPAEDGVLHELRMGDTLSDVAAQYDVELNAITTFTSNGIQTPDDIHEKQLVFVPGGTVAPPPPPEPVAEPTESPTDVPMPASDAASSPAAAEVEPEAPDFTPSAGLIWPVSGPISSYMGASHPLGIDIDLYNNPNAPVMAATSGVVTFAGGDPCCSYGLHVIVVSPGGIETLYAHLSSINVVQGQQVSQGEVLGEAGCTGYCTGNHLHFEVIDNGAREDPLDYLP